MWFPQNPKVLVVDDKYEEVKPLFNLFSMHGISYIHFDGKKDSLPKQPFSSVRLVILDIDLEGLTEGLDEKSKASALASYLEKLITIKESPYFILFWTKHEEIIDNFIKYLKLDDACPIDWKNMEKPTKEELTLDYIQKHFFSTISNDAFEFLLTWEDAVSKDASHFTNNISNIVKQETKKTLADWNVSMKNILSKFACSYLGMSKISSEDKDNALEYATSILNQSFVEILSLDYSKSMNISLPEKPVVTLETVAQLNSILFIEKCTDNKIENGKVYIDTEDDNIFELLKGKILSKKGAKTCDCQLLSVVLTPECDLAHRKYLYKNDPQTEYHRILYGIKIEIGSNIDYKSFFEYAASAYSKKVKIENTKLSNHLKKDVKNCISCNKPENLYETQPFIDEFGKICVIIFHFGTIQTKEIVPSSISFSYLLKNSLISDLQTKLANHVNRLGNSMLEY